MLNYVQTQKTNIPIQIQPQKKEEQATGADSPIQKSNKQEYLKLAAILFSGALLACGGMKLATSVINKVADETLLYSRVKKDEISKELFNFFKRSEKQGNTLTFSKEQIVAIDGLLNQETVPIFKSMLKINRYGRIKNDEMVKIVESMDEVNSKHVLKVMRAFENDYKYKPGSIEEILKSINEDNESFIDLILAKTEKRYSEDHLEHFLGEDIANNFKKITKENKASYELVASIRKDGKYTSFKMEEIQKLTDLIQNGKNSETLKYFSSLKAQNGVDYIYNAEDLAKIIEKADDELLETYTKLAQTFGENKIPEAIGKITKENVAIYDIFNSLDKNLNVGLYSGEKINQIVEICKERKNSECLKHFLKLKRKYRSHREEELVFKNPDSLIEILQVANDKYIDIYRSLGFYTSSELIEIAKALNDENANIARLYLSKPTRLPLSSTIARVLSGINKERAALCERFINIFYEQNKNVTRIENLLDDIFKLLNKHPDKNEEIIKEINQHIDNISKPGLGWDYLTWNKVLGELKSRYSK